MDRLVQFCLPTQLQGWVKQFSAPDSENAIMKDIPNSWYNHEMAKWLSKIIKIRKKYRGRSKYGYTRPKAYCHKEFADTFAIYER
jgi:hypothetical protein